MKKLFFNAMYLFAVLMMAASISSCEKDEGGKNEEVNNDDLYKSILQSYVSTTVVPTYKALAEATLEMRAANIALKSEPSDANMQAASDAWMKARIEWEKSEAFLFGPVGEQALDIDGHIDSWPLELKNIQDVLADGAIGLTGSEAWQMEPEVIGFHVTEYLLYREGKSRPVADLTEPELHYLTAATDALVWDCVLAYVAWVGEGNVPEVMKTVFHENPDVVAHLAGNEAYSNFTGKLSPRSEGGLYSSWSDALNEIAVGAADIAGEVGATKIEAPYSEKKVEEVESWYSWHSLDDYQNNIISIKNAYLGGLSDDTRQSVSLSSYLAKADADLDSRIKAKIDDCIAKIKAIGTGGKSFYEVVRDQVNATQVSAAVDACRELEELFGAVSESIE